MNKRIAFVVTGLTLSLTACGSLKVPGLSNDTVSAQQELAPPPDDPIERAVHVGATSARAQKCGYYFDPSQLKANFLTSETNRTPLPGMQGKLENAYNFSHNKITASIANAENYCTPDQTSKIKNNLTRYLAGDFSLPQKKQTATGGGFFETYADDEKQEKFSSETFYDPMTSSNRRR